MSKKLFFLTLGCLTFVGALFMMLASNMFFADIGNIAVDSNTATFYVTFAAGGVALTFVAAILYVIRLYKHPDCFKRLSRLYLIYAIVFNGVGLFGNIMSAITIYHSFVSKHPFPGFNIIFLVLELAIICGAVFGLLKLKARPEDEGKFKVTVKHVFKTIGWFLFISLVLNRFGSFLGAPFYIYWRNFHITFPFYIYLLVPLFLGVVEVLYIAKVLDKKQMLILAIAGMGANVVLFGYCALMGINNTGFISALSEAMPLERLASKPLEILIHFLAYSGVFAALLIQRKSLEQK